MKWTIKRSKWLRGNHESSLLNQFGRQCCIGQVCSQLGIPDKFLIGHGEVDAIIENNEEAVLNLSPILVEEEYRWAEVDWLDLAYGINDDIKITDFDREAKLQALALANGHEFEFID